MIEDKDKMHELCYLAGEEFVTLKNNIPLNKSNAEILAWTYKLHRLEGARQICTGHKTDDLEGEKMGYAVANLISKPIDFEEII